MGKYFLSPLTSRSTDLPVPALVILVRPSSLVEKATHSSSLADILKNRDLLVAASGDGESAARMKRATGGPVERVGNRPADGCELQPRHGLDAWNRLQQSLGIGM